MNSLVASLRSSRLLTASFALALASCQADDASPKPQSTTDSSHAHTADADKPASHPSAAGSETAPQRSAPDASQANTSDVTPTDTGSDASTPPASSSQTGGSAPAGGAVPASSGSAEYSWPADCEKRYTFRAHNANGVQDSSKKQVVAGAQYYASYYFRSPWTTQEVQGLKFRSIVDNKKIVHHWILYGVDSSTEQDGAVQGGVGQSIGTMQGEFYIAGWAPGAPDVALPDDVGLHMPAGASATFRLEIHYFNTSSTAVNEEDASGVEFCTSSKKRQHEAAVHWLGTTNLFVPAGMKTDIHSTCNPKITNGPVHLMSLSAHMHKTGVHARAILNRAKGGAPLTLIDDSFTFMEQNAFRQPRDGSAPDVEVSAGDKIDVTCSYDNMTADGATFGSNTENEMCFFYAMAWPRGQLSNGLNSFVPGAEPEVNCIQ